MLYTAVHNGSPAACVISLKCHVAVILQFCFCSLLGLLEELLGLIITYILYSKSCQGPLYEELFIYLLLQIFSQVITHGSFYCGYPV